MGNVKSQISYCFFLIAAERFESNGTHIRITLSSGEVFSEMIGRLTHNRTHLVIAQYALYTEQLRIDPGSLCS